MKKVREEQKNSLSILSSIARKNAIVQSSTCKKVSPPPIVENPPVLAPSSKNSSLLFQNDYKPVPPPPIVVNLPPAPPALSCVVKSRISQFEKKPVPLKKVSPPIVEKPPPAVALWNV